MMAEATNKAMLPSLVDPSATTTVHNGKRRTVKVHMQVVPSETTITWRLMPKRGEDPARRMVWFTYNESPVDKACVAALADDLRAMFPERAKDGYETCALALLEQTLEGVREAKAADAQCASDQEEDIFFIGLDDC